ncbi:MAG: type IX secretion system membrane protein PorP/SprF [Bacteroidales bacterium]|nr:type IX secretion system membrane protein PorP/SprF [Bacteroidales bacterium]
MRRSSIFILLIISCSHFINAQQDPMFTHYAFNTLAINPAYAGSRDALTITGLHRTQWVSFEGAPTTQTLTAHSPIIKENIGIGLSLLNDKIGPTNTSSLYLDFSYKIKINQRAKLSFGLKGGLNLQKTDLTSLNIKEINDPLFIEDIKSEILPNFGFGLYYYTDKYYVGISIPKLLENDFNENSVTASTNLASEKKHYFLIGGSVFKLSQSIVLKPTTFIKITNGAPIEADLTANFIILERFWAGIMYRTGDAFGAITGLNITDQLAVGYSFDFSIANTTVKYNGGSHEIMVRYDFIFKERKMIRSPRYF